MSILTRLCRSNLFVFALGILAAVSSTRLESMLLTWVAIALIATGVLRARHRLSKSGMADLKHEHARIRWWGS